MVINIYCYDILKILKCPATAQQKKITNLEGSTSKLGPLKDQECNNISYNYSNNLEIGSIQFIPDSHNIIIPNAYGLCDGKTGYYRFDHLDYFEKFGNNLAEVDINPLVPGNMTSNNSLGFTVSCSGTDEGQTGGKCFSDINDAGHIRSRYGHEGPAYLSIKSNNSEATYKITSYYLHVLPYGNGGLLRTWHLDGYKRNGSYDRIKTGYISPEDAKKFVNEHGTHARAEGFTIDNGTSQAGYQEFRLVISEYYDSTYFSIYNTGVGGFQGFDLLRVIYNAIMIENEFNYRFRCPDLQSIAPPGFKTYIYMGI